MGIDIWWNYYTLTFQRNKCRITDGSETKGERDDRGKKEKEEGDEEGRREHDLLHCARFLVSYDEIFLSGWFLVPSSETGAGL